MSAIAEDCTSILKSSVTISGIRTIPVWTSRLRVRVDDGQVLHGRELPVYGGPGVCPCFIGGCRDDLEARNVEGVWSVLWMQKKMVGLIWSDGETRGQVVENFTDIPSTRRRQHSELLEKESVTGAQILHPGDENYLSNITTPTSSPATRKDDIPHPLSPSTRATYPKIDLFPSRWLISWRP